MQTWITRYVPWLLVLALLATAAGLHARTALAVQSPEAAIRADVESLGSRYAGDCAATVSPRDVGAVCSRLVDEQDAVHAYLTGRTFSEFSRWIFVAPDEDGWRVIADAPLKFDSESVEIPWP